MSKLKPCPLCGGEAVASKGAYVWYVSCTEMDCCVAINHGKKPTAIRRWNRRATPPQDRARL